MPRRGRSLDVHFLLAFAAIAVVLLVFLITTFGRSGAQQVRFAHERHLRNVANALATTIENRYFADTRAIETAAGLLSNAPDRDPAYYIDELKAIHRVNPQFLTMLIADGEGRVLATSPPVDPHGRPIAPRSLLVRDREYFRVPMRTATTYISDLFRGRGLGTDPIVAVATPLVSGGRTWGILEGSLDVRRFLRESEIVELWPGTELVIVDRRRAVIDSSVPSIPVLSRFDKLPPLEGRGPAVLSRDGESLMARRVTAHGVEVIARTDLTPLEGEIVRAYVTTVGAVFGVVAVVMLAAYLVARRVIRALRALHKSVSTYSPGLEGVRDPIPESPLLEIAQLGNEFEHLQSRLDGTFRDLENLVHTQERVIADRTAELRAANEELQQLVRVDELTSLPNLRRFTERLEQGWKLAIREHATMALLMIDVDSFKPFNDTYGHEAGNEALRRVAVVIGDAARRPLDLAARYGGEEFVVLLPFTGAEEATKIAEKLRARIEALAIPNEASPFRVVTASIGITAAVPSRDMSSSDLVEAADRALYGAKKTRNAVCCAATVDGEQAVTS